MAGLPGHLTRPGPEPGFLVWHKEQYYPSARKWPVSFFKAAGSTVARAPFPTGAGVGREKVPTAK